MKYPEQIVTVDNFVEFSIKEKGSTFIGQVHHGETEKEAQEILTSVQKKFYDATHHCYACRLLDQKFKYSDDGEPTGTAGIRILNAIDHFKVLNVIVIVIRYYGGTKLGVGPLGKAYYNSALTVLEKAKKITKALYQQISIEASFDYINHIHKALSDHQAIIASSEYGDRAIFECRIKPPHYKELSEKLANISRGEIQISAKEEAYYYK